MDLLRLIPNYSTHPAYSSFSTNTNYDNTLLNQLISQIDTNFKKIESTAYPDLKNLKHDFKKNIIPIIDQIESHTIKNARYECTKKILNLALTEVKKQLEFDLRIRNESHYYQNKISYHDKFYSTYTDFNELGVAKLTADEKYFPHINQETLKYKDILLQKVKNNPFGRSDYSIPRADPIWNIFNQFLKDNKIIEVISDYKRANMQLMYLALEYSHADQIWYKNGYLDVGIPTTKTTYIHCDYGYNMVKAMVYLNPTKKNNGAFSYIHGSHKWNRSPFLFALYRDLDIESQKVIGFQAKGYYRNRFANPKHRQELLDLPKMFQGTSHFGDDLIDDSEASNFFLQNEVCYEGNPGDLIVFDGERGLHRGSMVESGERYALQIGFVSKDLRIKSELYKDKIKYQTQRVQNKIQKVLKKITNLDTGST